MKLTIVERMTLMNQFKILAHLENTNEYANYIKILQNGYEYEYGEMFQWIEGMSLPEPDCLFVKDVLEAYGCIQRCGKESGNTSITTHPFYKFSGFDGNDEGEYLGYARFMIQDQGKWNYLEMSGDNLNSHMPTLDKYRAMVQKWKGCANPLNLTAQEAIDILNS